VRRKRKGKRAVVQIVDMEGGSDSGKLGGGGGAPTEGVKMKNWGTKRERGSS